MPLVDLSLAVLLLACAAWVLARRRGPGWMHFIFAAAIPATLIMQLLWIGPHWQMLPAYLGCVLLLSILVAGRAPRLLAAASVLLALATIGFLWVLPLFTLPPPTGVYAVGTTGPIQWTDPTRNRELAVQVWYPAPAGWHYGRRARYTRLKELKPLFTYEANIRTNALLAAPLADASLPVLIFGHRWGASRTQDTFLAEDLASHGFVVVAADHPGNSARMLRADGSVVRSTSPAAFNDLEASTLSAIEAVWAQEIAVWVADDQFLLDKLQQENAGWFAGHLDLTRVGAFGHSFGGAVAVALLGQDVRVKAAVNLDGWTLNAIDRRTTQPVLFVYAGGVHPLHPGPGVEGQLERADDAVVEASIARFGGLRAYVEGAQHLDFTDQTLVSPLRRLTYAGSIPGPRVREITRGLVLGFFDQSLCGHGTLPQYPEVKLIR